MGQGQGPSEGLDPAKWPVCAIHLSPGQRPWPPPVPRQRWHKRPTRLSASQPTYQNVAETAKTVAMEGDKQHSEIQKSKVYSAPVRAQRSHLQSLSTRSLFSVTFIHYKVLIFPCKHPGPPPIPKQTVFLPKKLSKQGYRSGTDKQCWVPD